MATMTFSLTTATGTVSRTATFADSDAARLRDAYAALYAADLPPNPTPSDIWTALCRGVFDGIKANVLSHETAAQQPAVGDIPLNVGA